MIDGWRSGREWCTNGKRAAAYMLREFWRLLDGLGPGVHLQKCKGHATEKDVEEGRATRRTMLGNGHADTFACRGTDIAEDISPNSQSTEDFIQARFIASS